MSPRTKILSALAALLTAIPIGATAAAPAAQAVGPALLPFTVTNSTGRGDATYLYMIGVNLTGMYLACKHGVKAIKATAGKGAVVLTGSPTGMSGCTPANIAYGSSKGGVHGLSRVMAVDHAPEGIRVNVVVPGFTLTPIWADMSSRRGCQSGPMEAWFSADRMEKTISLGGAVAAGLSLQADRIRAAAALRPTITLLAAAEGRIIAGLLPRRRLRIPVRRCR